MNGITITLGADIASLRKGMASAAALVSDMSKRMGQLAGKGMAGVGAGLGKGLGLGLKVGIGTALAGGTGALAGAAALMYKGIGKAADMESFETAFVPLLGGIKEAKERMADLAEFAKTTPFELPEVVQASRMLEVLTKGALATSEGLTLVGDAASVAQQPMEDVAMWVGRLYDGLQSGRPVGEAMMRLQEMGLIAGDTRGRIEKLAESGAAGNVVWEEARKALGRFSGGMSQQSRTWKGKLSNLADAWGQLLTKLGTPVIDALKPYLDGVIAKVESMKPAFAALGENIRTTLDVIRGAWDTGNLAELVGSGLVLGAIQGVNAFSSGIRKSVAYLGAALSEIMASATNSIELGKLLSVFESLAKGLGRYITAAIIEGLENVPYIGGAFYKGEGADNAKIASGYMDQAMRSIADFNGSAAMQGAVDAVKRANTAGNEAADKAGNANVIDPKKAMEAFQSIVGPLKQNADDIRRADEIRNGYLSKKPVEAAPSGSVAAATKEALRLEPIVTSLGRVGGGGYGGGALDAQRENNKLTGQTNALLAAIRDKLSTKPVPAWGGAAFG